MIERQQTSACRVVPITAAPPARAMHSPSELALICSTRAINLAELAESIRANQSLCFFVTETACREFGQPSLRVEDAIVLLGGKRLSALLSGLKLRDRSANQSRRALYNNSITPSTKLCLLETLQGEPE